LDCGDVDYGGRPYEDAEPSFDADTAATLSPSDWPEPFGLVMIGALTALVYEASLERPSTHAAYANNAGAS
jgi:hypothetical protein